MAVNRLLYSSQTCLITVGGALKSVGGVFQYENNDSDSIDSFQGGPASDTAQWSGGFTYTKDYLLAVQTASVDETIPQDDVLVMGNKDGVGRLQKDVASSKCTVKAYLPEYMKWNDGYDTATPANVQFRDAGKLNWNDANGVWDGHSRQTGFTDATANSGASNVDVGTAQDASDAQAFDWTTGGPWPGITDMGFLAGESMAQTATIGRQGLLESLVFESQGGFESRVQLYRPNTSGATNDGFTFYGILSSIGIDVSKGAYPTLDLNFEGAGQIDFLAMGIGGTDEDPSALGTANAGLWYIDSCHPHTSDDILIWGTERDNISAGTYAFSSILVAGSAHSYYQDEVIAGIVASGSATSGDNTYGANSLHGGAGHPKQGSDTINSAKLSYDMPTETLTALGQTIVGKTTQVRGGNRTFSKPPYKASLALDGQGLMLAGHMSMNVSPTPDELNEEIKPHEVQIGQMVVNVGGNYGDAAAVSARSFSQNVGDVGATYSVTLEGTEATFHAQHSWQDAGGRLA